MWIDERFVYEPGDGLGSSRARFSLVGNPTVNLIDRSLFEANHDSRGLALVVTLRWTSAPFFICYR